MGGSTVDLTEATKSSLLIPREKCILSLVIINSLAKCSLLYSLDSSGFINDEMISQHLPPPGGHFSNSDVWAPSDD